MRKPFGYVYLITNKVNGKQYVGKTEQSLGSRWSSHKYSAKSGVKTRLYHSMRKHGVNNFTLTTLHKTNYRDELNRLESEEIANRNTTNPKAGYNMTDGGDGVSGFDFSVESRNKISKSAKDMWSNPEFKAKQKAKKKAFYSTEEGKKSHASSVGSFERTAEYRDKHKTNSLLMWQDDSYRARHKAAMDKAMSDPDYKAEQSRASKARWADPNFREKWTASRKNMVHPRALPSSVKAEARVLISQNMTDTEISRQLGISATSVSRLRKLMLSAEAA